MYRRLIDKEYKMKNFSIEKCLDLGFTYDLFSSLSKTQPDVLMYTFPLYKYKKTTLIYGVIRIFIERKMIRFSVLNRQYYTYAPFEHPDYAHKKFVSKLDKRFEKELKKLDIVEKKKR